ncbi:2-oxoacid:acceptor oxidoreductase family protein [Paenibacillus caui]|uniref:2-oxoacid:acceptor oxidoreductase family protein n=1 Tax=Paenibacillus caui TaxID=2873927 RepID=UPI001CA95511|nr:2-oxoacid:acceptor oxidoreductase family protein [Paenibacillus caui]
MQKLPQVNKLGFFEIRLESIGGLGANLAGKMLAEAGVTGAGFGGVSFSSYGSEKKGSPVKAHIRFCDPHVPIRHTSPVEFPHVLGIFQEGLIRSKTVLSGALAGSTVLVNSKRTPQQLQEQLKLAEGTIAVIDATGIALEEKNRVNMAMLGALFRLCPFLDPEQMKEVIRKSLSGKYPQAISAALNTFERGYAEVGSDVITASDLAAAGREAEAIHSDAAVLGYETQPIGGVITNPGNSIFKDLSISRGGKLPHYHADSCIHCAQCDNVCPDLCFVWEELPDKKGRPQMFLKGIDYQYCKGCLKCVHACPTDALTGELEEENYASENRVPHVFDLAGDYA